MTAHHPRLRRAIGVVAIIAVLQSLLTACLFGPSDEEHKVAVALWGPSAPKDPDNASYQKDVVVLGDGAMAIKGYGATPLTYRLDAGADGVEELKVGKVLFATSNVMGRVAKLKKEDDEVVVTLAPADLPELFEDAQFAFKTKVNGDDFRMTHNPRPVVALEIPDSSEADAESGKPGGAAVPAAPPTKPASSVPPLSAGGGAVAAGGVLAAMRSVGTKTDKETDKEKERRRKRQEEAEAKAAKEEKEKLEDPDYVPGGYLTQLGPVKVVSTVTDHEFGMRAFYDADANEEREEKESEERVCLVATKVGLPCPAHKEKNEWGLEAIKKTDLKIELDTILYYDRLTVDAEMGIKKGQWIPKPTIIMDGLDRLTVAIKGTSKNGLADNVKFKVEIPLESSATVMVGQVPLNLRFKTTFLLATGFSAKKSSLMAKGVYNLHGSLGLRKGKLETPALSVDQPMVKSVTGLSMGFNMVVAAVSLKVQAGLGTDLLSVGPYNRLVMSVGLLHGSAAMAPWGVPCQVSLKVEGGAGIGMHFNKGLVGALQTLLGRFAPKPKEEDSKTEKEWLEVNATLVDRTAKFFSCPNAVPGGINVQPVPVEAKAKGNDPFTATGSPGKPGGKGTQSNDEFLDQDTETYGQESPPSPNNYDDEGKPTGANPPPGEDPECYFPIDANGDPLLQVPGFAVVDEDKDGKDSDGDGKDIDDMDDHDGVDENGDGKDQDDENDTDGKDEDGDGKDADPDEDEDEEVEELDCVGLAVEDQPETAVPDDDDKPQHANQELV